MNKSKDLKKDQFELKKQFNNSVKCIQEWLGIISKKRYDDPMRLEYSKAIAIKLRVLLIDRKSKSLITQLGIKDKILFTPICAKMFDMPGNLIDTYNLIEIKYDDAYGLYCCSAFEKNTSDLRCTLDCWLDEIVIDGKQGSKHKISRKDVILLLADKEGGAHVDPFFDEEYYHIIYESGFEVVNKDGSVRGINNNYFAETMITIAYEFLEAANEYLEQLCGSEFAVCSDDLSIVELVYKDESIRKRYYTYYDQDVPNGIAVLYDYTEVVDYRLLFTKNYYFRKNGLDWGRRVIDDRNYHNILFCIGVPSSIIFIKSGKKYYQIKEAEDLHRIQTLNHYTFSQAIRLINDEYEKNKMMNHDCLCKQQIYVEHKSKNI